MPAFHGLPDVRSRAAAVAGLAPLQIPTLPDPPSLDSLGSDTSDLLPIGTAAERILEDPLATIPERVYAWALEVYAGFVLILPRLLAAVVAAAIIIALTLWLRNLVRRRSADPDSPAPGSVGVAGVLVAVTVAAAIAGAITLAAALLTFTIFYAIAALLHVFGLKVLSRSRVAPEAVELTLIVMRYAILVVGAVEAIDTLGLDLGAVIAGLGILGLAVGFAAQDSLANLIAGFMIMWDRSLRVGDWVRISDHEGRVKRITLRTTRIDTRDDGILVIPNKEVTGSSIFNYSLRNLSRIRVPVGVDYDADIARAREVLLGIVPDDLDVVSRRPEPTVIITELGDSAVTMELVFFITDPRELAPLRWRMFEDVLLAFRRNGIEITYPQLNVNLQRIPDAQRAGDEQDPEGRAHQTPDDSSSSPRSLT
ncbi:MAG: mechanosensitive ion channel family protein [Gemmatimonadaceae bacterium]